MTGGSLGLRTGSYGSLQQQQLQNSVIVPIPIATPVVLRKSTKMLLPGSRDKERFLPWICKIAGRRKAGMFLLVLVSVLVFMSVLSALSKDEDAPEIRGESHESSRFIRTFGTDNVSARLSYYNLSFFSRTPYFKRDSKPPLLEIMSRSSENKTQPRPPVLSAVIPPHIHPCNNFAFPPPPADKKRTGPRPCPVCYLPVEQAIVVMPTVPSVSPVLKDLTYIVEPESSRPRHLFGGSAFGGYPSLTQRDISFDIKESMTIHCGFVRGNKPGHQTGFDINDADLFEMEQCRGLVVASAVFGNYDEIQQPKNISEAAKSSVCFYMFVDEETASFINKSNTLDSSKRVGLWRVVVARNLPYTDARRNGKVPKLLLHRIFPNARFSIWIDGKLELVVDPYQILERFLWRKNATFAISRHYRRFDVYDEAEANKAAGKYDNASIDSQIDFYRKEGLSHYSSAKLPITSDVPEGCVIIKEHIPITNLFTCLWFNEVDRFTSRDQISFSTVRDKIMSRVNWSIEMFLDCERRNFVIQAYHRDVLHQRRSISNVAPALPTPVLASDLPERSSPELVSDRGVRNPAKKVSARRGRDKRSGTRRHRPRPTNIRDNNSF